LVSEVSIVGATALLEIVKRPFSAYPCGGRLPFTTPCKECKGMQQGISTGQRVKFTANLAIPGILLGVSLR
jgi:hypothetical protein